MLLRGYSLREAQHKSIVIFTCSRIKAWPNEPVDSGKFEDPDYQGKNFVLPHEEEEEQQAETVTSGSVRDKTAITISRKSSTT
jgi:hypothetical protein